MNEELMTSVRARLLDEIERVSSIRYYYKSNRDIAAFDVEPHVRMMTEAIDHAKAALRKDDPEAEIRALEALKEIEA